jgi:hypothetical protein
MSFLRRLRGQSSDAASGQPREVAGIYADLRDAILHLDPASVGIHQGPETPNAWGLVMDWSLDEAVATIVSLADGTTSMYLSTGGGTIGAGEHPAAAAASVNAVRIAEGMLDGFAPVTASPVPVRGRTALTLLTFRGLRRFEDDTEAFENGSSRLAPVANAMQAVISEIRQAQASSDRGSPQR